MKKFGASILLMAVMVLVIVGTLRRSEPVSTTKYTTGVEKPTVGSTKGLPRAFQQYLLRQTLASKAVWVGRGPEADQVVTASPTVEVQAEINDCSVQDRFPAGIYEVIFQGKVKEGATPGTYVHIALRLDGSNKMGDHESDTVVYTTIAASKEQSVQIADIVPLTEAGHTFSVLVAYGSGGSTLTLAANSAKLVLRQL